MKNNLKVVNLIVSGSIKLKNKISFKQQNKLINIGWFSPREDNIMMSKQFEFRKEEFNVHHRQKNPYVTIWCSGAIVIVGLRNIKEANNIYNLVIKDLKKVKII